ncbi:MAG: carboxypeptidase regulatory-like domain-containing protein [Myxococcaceae bacterium]
MNRRAPLAVFIAVVVALVAWLALRGDEADASTPAQVSSSAPTEPVVDAGSRVPGARVAGVVLRDGKPVLKARVTLRAVAPLVAWTDPQGRFSFDDLGSGQVYLSANGDDAASEVLGPLELKPATHLDELVLTLSPALSVEGRVIDLTTQAPIAGATWVTPGGAGKTDAAGRFTLSGPKSQTWLDLSAPGYLSRTQWVSLELARAGGRLEVVLTPSSVLEGVVMEGASPVAAATVWAEVVEGASRGEHTPIVFTDKEGHFSLECRAGSLQLAAVTPRGTRIKGPFMRVAVGEKKKGLVLEATEVSSATGVVLLGDQPLPGAQVNAIDAQTEELAGITTTAPDGQFRFDALAQGRYVLQVRAGAFTATAGPFEQQGDGVPWQVKLQAGATMSGRVEPASAGVVVRWRSGSWSGPSAQTVTDEQGRFKFEGLPNELVSVDAEGPAGAATVRARAGQDVVLVLRKTEVIVHLRDDHGGPVTDGAISARSLDTGTTRSQLVLAPDGVTRLELPTGRWELFLEVAGRGRSQPATVTVGDVPAEATLVLQATLNVRGHVFDKATNLPLTGARVEAVSGESGKSFRVSVLTDSRGEFQLPPVPGASLIVVTRDGYLPQWRPIAQQPWEFSLDPARADQKTPQLSQFEGVGMTLDGRTGQVKVVLVSEGSPAERAGVQAGDAVILVDGVAVTGMPIDQVVNRIRGPAGTPVVIQFQRQGQPIELTIRRKLLTL